MDIQQQSKQFPRFIQNKPYGIDKFDGGSQERLAKTIARHFRQSQTITQSFPLMKTKLIQLLRKRAFFIIASLALNQLEASAQSDSLVCLRDSLRNKDAHATTCKPPSKKAEQYPHISQTDYKPYQYDNGDDYVSDNRYRIVSKENKVGYADPSGYVVIKPRFAFGFPFKNGKAKVTDTGEEKEVEGSNGEYHYWDSDDWYYIDEWGNKINE